MTYIPSHFEISESESLKLIKDISFGQIMIIHQGRIIQAFIPFELDIDEMCLYGHVAKKNELLNGLDGAIQVTVNFFGDHTYISPSWYLSTDQVPTWNYQVVVVEGKATTVNKEETLKIITQLSAIHEEKFEQPWTMDKLPEKKTNAMLGAIVGFRIDITNISGKSKMSQNKDQKNRDSLIAGLRSQDNSVSKKVSEIMNTTKSI
ncbi:MAG: hypothetical protein COB38_05685 [Gammaproteobacteria bacterium]|nr:MAG: hypothetical protein COB38_05685 [Gammaproteobacteria bacterium]